VLRTRCRGYLKIRQRVDDPVPDIVARDIVEHLERCGYRIVRAPQGIGHVKVDDSGKHSRQCVVSVAA
jgi:hypothetical protein